MSENQNEIISNSTNSLINLSTKDISSNLTSEKNLITISPYEFKDEPIQIVLASEGRLETTAEAINILYSLKNQKLCILSINGPSSTGKSALANKIIDKNNQGFIVKEKTQGILIWGNPITLNNGAKLLILDCQGLNKNEEDGISEKLYILSILLSTYIVYNTEGELTNEKIKDFIYFTDMTKKIKVQEGENNDNLNNANNLKKYLPKLFFVNNIESSEKMKDIIEKNTDCETLCKLFEHIDYINYDNYKDLVDKIKSEMKFKTIKQNIMDGYSLFGLLQNYIDFINNGEVPIIKSALENILLSKAKNESELIFEDFKNKFSKKMDYPMSITDIYKIYLELQLKSTDKFCKKVEKYLTPTQTGEYIQKIFKDMEKELESNLETNKDYYTEWFDMEYKELEDVMNKINFESNAKAFISTYTSTLQTCLIKFSNIPNTDFCKDLLITLSKIFQNFVIDKLNKMGEKINDMNENYSQESNTNIENLNNEIKNLNEQIDKNRKLLEETNKEKSELNKNFLEIENKFEKLNRESKAKEKEYENNLKIEVQKYQKMETYYNSQIKEKEQKIINLESKIENLNHEILGSEKPSMKEDELNSQNNNPSESQIVKNEDGKEKPMVSDEQTSNLQNLFKNMQTTFMELKIKVDKIDKENENIFKSQNLENYTIIFEEKLNTCINEVKTFFEKQIKALNENYEKELNKIKSENDELNVELTKMKIEANEKAKLNEVNEAKLEESIKQINQLKEISKSKDSLIDNQNDSLKMYSKKINEFKKMKEDLELSLAKNIYNFKMKEDEYESLFMVIDGIISKKKEKYEHNFNKLSPDVQTMLETLAKQFKFFK